MQRVNTIIIYATSAAVALILLFPSLPFYALKKPVHFFKMQRLTSLYFYCSLITCAQKAKTQNPRIISAVGAASLRHTENAQ